MHPAVFSGITQSLTDAGNLGLVHAGMTPGFDPSSLGDSPRAPWYYNAPTGRIPGGFNISGSGPASSLPPVVVTPPAANVPPGIPANLHPVTPPYNRPPGYGQGIWGGTRGGISTNPDFGGAQGFFGTSIGTSLPNFGPPGGFFPGHPRYIL